MPLSILPSQGHEFCQQPKWVRKLFFPSNSPWWLIGEDPSCQCRRCGVDPRVRKIHRRKKWQPIPVFLPGKSHGQRSLVGYSLQDHKELDMTWWLNNKNNNKTSLKKYKPANTLILAWWDFVTDLPIEVWGKFVLFKPLSLWWHGRIAFEN